METAILAGDRPGGVQEIPRRNEIAVSFRARSFDGAPGLWCGADVEGDSGSQVEFAGSMLPAVAAGIGAR